MARFLYLSTGAREAIEKIKQWETARLMVTIGDVYANDLENLGSYDALLIGTHVDQRRLAARSDRIAAYLEQGGKVVANGHVAYPYLPQITAFRAVANYSVNDLVVRRHVAHPVWDGIPVEDLSQRRGVSGFYARGWHMPPHGARVVHTIGNAERPVDFIYRVGKGQVLFHGGNDLWSLADAGTTASRLAPQLLEWAATREDRQ
jgi:hypothetical protein